jgi:flagellar hook-associated protein 3 FlgL
MSIYTRTTDLAASQQSIDYLDNDLGTIQQLEQQSETGMKIQSASDDPTGAVQVLSLNSQISRFSGYQNAATDGQNWLNQADSALQSVVTELNSVYSATEAGANQTTSDSSTNAALAATVSGAITNIMGAANTQYNGQYLFGGTALLSGASPPYTQDSTGSITYNGNTSAMRRQVGPGSTGQATVSVPGSAIFGSGTTVATSAGTVSVSGTGVFAVLSQIKADLTSNPSNLSSDLASLQAVITNVTTQDGVVGGLSASVANTGTELTSKMTTLNGSLGDVQDADMASVLTSLNLEESAYQAALETAAKLVQPSLATFLS